MAQPTSADLPSAALLDSLLVDRFLAAPPGRLGREGGSAGQPTCGPEPCWIGLVGMPSDSSDGPNASTYTIFFIYLHDFICVELISTDMHFRIFQIQMIHDDTVYLN